MFKESLNREKVGGRQLTNNFQALLEILAVDYINFQIGLVCNLSWFIKNDFSLVRARELYSLKVLFHSAFLAHAGLLVGLCCCHFHGP